MKKYNLVAILALAFGLNACVMQKEAVDVVQTQQDTTAVASTSEKAPANATAICRDGSYSTAKDNTACVGNGGVVTQINRYFSE